MYSDQEDVESILQNYNEDVDGALLEHLANKLDEVFDLSSSEE